MARVLGLWTGARSLGQTQREESDCRASARRGRVPGAPGGWRALPGSPLLGGRGSAGVPGA